MRAQKTTGRITHRGGAHFTADVNTYRSQLSTVNVSDSRPSRLGPCARPVAGIERRRLLPISRPRTPSQPTRGRYRSAELRELTHESVAQELRFLLRELSIGEHFAGMQLAEFL
jgi:hypothetical protein